MLFSDFTSSSSSSLNLFIVIIRSLFTNISLLLFLVHEWIDLSCLFDTTVVVQWLNHVKLFAAPWTVACQAPLSLRFPKEILEWAAISSPWDFPIPGVKLTSPALAGRFFTTKPPGKPLFNIRFRSSQWCHPAIPSSVVPFSCPQSLPASESFPMHQLFTWGDQSTGVSASASFLPKKSRGWSPSE